MNALWSYDELSRLSRLARHDYRLRQLAQWTHHTVAEVELALWQLLGRDLAEACDAINADAARWGALEAQVAAELHQLRGQMQDEAEAAAEAYNRKIMAIGLVES